MVNNNNLIFVKNEYEKQLINFKYTTLNKKLSISF